MPIQLVSDSIPKRQSTCCGYLTVFTLIKELYAFLVQYYENRIEHFIISFLNLKEFAFISSCKILLFSVLGLVV